MPIADAIPTLTRPALSYWEATAIKAPSDTPMRGDQQVDVLIVGAGLTGLSAAWHLQKAGMACLVLDANEVGWGASGRNGGMLPPRYKKGFAALAKRHGNDVTRRLHRLIHEAVDGVEAIVDEASLACGFERCGQFTAALGPNHLASLQADAEWAAAEAGDRTPRILNASEATAEIGGGAYMGGWLDIRGAGIHPLSYTRGLARSLIDRGVLVHSATPVLSLQESDNCVIAVTPRGTVKAKHAILATNAYTDLHNPTNSDITRRIIPVTSSVIATAPLGSNVAKYTMPARRMVSDTRSLMFYCRLMPDGTMVFGGRGDITGKRDDPSVYAGLELGLTKTFPHLSGTKIAFRWSGKVAVTMDDFPHLGQLSNRIIYAMGYGGRGVALSNLLGRMLADTICSVPVDIGPMGDKGFKRIPFHAFRSTGMKIMAGWYRFKDTRELAASSARRPKS